MSKLKGVILDFNSLAPQTLDCSELMAIEGVDWQVFEQTQPEQVIARAENAHIIFTNKVVLDAERLAQMPHLKYIGVLATGTNNIDIEACEKKGVVVRNVAGYGTATVAQHTLMLMLNLATSAFRYQNAVNQGKWALASQFCLLDYPVVELNGKHLVIVGYGELGQAVAKLAVALGMRVSVAIRPGETKGCSTTNTYELNGESFKRQALDDLLPEADFVSLHCTLTPETEYLFNQQRFRLMCKTGFLINTARGGLVDEEALLEALQSGQIAGAGLDVLSAEPPPSDHILLKANLPNLIVTPHTAWSANEARQRLLNIAVSHLKGHLANI